MKEELFRQIVDENYCKIYRICYRYFGNRDEAGDACQETFMKMWLNINKFRGEASLSTWACRIAINVCLTFKRLNKRQMAHIVSEQVTDYQDCISDENEEHQDHDEKLQYFHRFIGRLPVADRTLVALYLEDMDSREIASVTGLSEANVRTRIHRIKNQIKKEWEENNGTR
jgi:RNA polymerase sigma-70 factor (ECF subfamily)